MSARLVIVLLFLSGCTVPPRHQWVEPMAPAGVQRYMTLAAGMTGRALAPLPGVYFAADALAFHEYVCKEQRAYCGFYEPKGVYIKPGQIVVVNTVSADGIPVDSVVLHEMVHYLQDVQRDKRTCQEREEEAYGAQFMFSQYHPYWPLWQYAFNSCFQ